MVTETGWRARVGVMSIARCYAHLAPALAVLFLLALRLIVLSSDGAGAALGGLGAIFSTEPTAALRVGQLLVQSLCFEGFVLLALGGLVRLRSAAARWLARGGLLLLLWLNLAGTMVFLVLRTYVKGFQLTGLSFGEIWEMASAFIRPVPVLGLAVGLGISLAFGRGDEGAQAERRRLPPRTRVLLGVLALIFLGGAVRLLYAPTRFPSVAHSPLTLLLVRVLPEGVARVPTGEPSPEDWAPAPALAPRWAHLSEAERRFNVVVVVLESVRADIFWPAPGAPPTPNLARLAPHAAVFTRAYVHEPLSVKGLEALLFGVYPAPFWETLGGKWSGIALDSVGERWARLGLRTAFVGNADVPFVGEEGFLKARGFSRYIGPPELERLDPAYNDRTLVAGLDRFLEEVPGERFAAILWPHQTHLPYQLPPPLTNRHPPNSFAAYKDTVAFLDLVIGDLAAVLERRGLWENTVVVLVADHGESFAEHPDAGLAHGDRLYETSARIPLMLINPRLFHGERDERIVQQKDVAPTLAWLAGDERPHLNAGSCLFYERPSETAYLISHLDVTSLRGALVRGRWKYQYTGAVGEVGDDERLYDLAADPGETRNLWADHPEEGQALRRRYFGWLQHWNERWMAVEREGGPVQDRARLERMLFGAGP